MKPVNDNRDYPANPLVEITAEDMERQRAFTNMMFKPLFGSNVVEFRDYQRTPQPKWPPADMLLPCDSEPA